MTPDEAGFDLALQFQALGTGQDGRVVLYGCCWTLAGLVIQAHAERDVTLEHSIALITAELVRCVEKLATVTHAGMH